MKTLFIIELLSEAALHEKFKFIFNIIIAVFKKSLLILKILNFNL